MSEQSNSPTSPPAGTGGPADAPGKSSGGGAKAAGLGIAGDAAKAKAGGATNSEVVSGAAKQGVQKVAEAGVKKATGSEIAVDALHSAQKVKNGDVVGGAQNLAASGANAATTLAVGATGVGAPVATLAGSAAGSLVNSKAGRYAIVGVLASALVAGGAVVGTGALITAGSIAAISSVIGDDITSASASTCSDGGSTGGGSVSLTGTGIEQKVWNFMLENGYTEEQAAGVMGNIKRESQFNPFIAEGATGTPNTSRGWGLVQWTGVRHVQIRDAVTSELGADMYVASPSFSEMPAGFDQSKVDQMVLFQLNYILKELNGAEKAAGDHLRSTTTVAEAAKSFEEKYERAGVVALEERIANAEAYYKQFSGSGGGTPAPAPDADAPAPAAPAPPADNGIDTSKLESPVAGYDGEAMKRALEIHQAIKAAGGPDEASILAITTALTESGLGMDNDVMDSPDAEGKQGLYRMVVEKGHDPFVGKAALETTSATNAWYKGVAGKKGLKEIDGWKGMAPELAIQKVQQTPDSDNFNFRGDYEDAKKIFAYVSKLDPASLSAGSVTETDECGGGGGGVSLITGDNSGPVNAALGLVPKKYPYVFGGGNGDGPSASNTESKDAGEIGFDCSGVTSFAYKQGAGIELPRTARAQWAKYKANRVSVEDIQPGDLIFWAYGRLGSTVSHVAIYVGDGQMVEASRGANLVKQTPARLSGSGFVGVARVLDGTETADAGGAGDTVGDARME